MNSNSIDDSGKIVDEKISQTYSLILSKPHLREFVDIKHEIPRVFRGTGKIRLIVIGQDPTIINKASRKNITSVLGLDKPGKMQRYLYRICEGLDIDPLKELYATNLFKNFFEEPPDHNSDVLKKFFELWFPVLKEETAQFPCVPIVVLGDHVLNFLTGECDIKFVRNYWGYHENWKKGMNEPFKHLLPEENLLTENIYPFPRVSSIIKEFYFQRFDNYINYIKSTFIWNEDELEVH
jgi:uracil-DNA glycosylase